MRVSGTRKFQRRSTGVSRLGDSLVRLVRLAAQKLEGPERKAMATGQPCVSMAFSGGIGSAQEPNGPNTRDKAN